MEEQIKRFERALESGLRRHLLDKQILKNGNGQEYRLAQSPCANLFLSSKDEHKNNLIECLLENTTNYYPCLTGYVELKFVEEEHNGNYFFHISGEKFSSDDADYSIKINEGNIKIEIKSIDYFFKQGNRLW